jgi:hypothetical protein
MFVTVKRPTMEKRMLLPLVSQTQVVRMMNLKVVLTIFVVCTPLLFFRAFLFVVGASNEKCSVDESKVDTLWIVRKIVAVRASSPKNPKSAREYHVYFDGYEDPYWVPLAFFTQPVCFKSGFLFFALLCFAVLCWVHPSG